MRSFNSERDIAGVGHRLGQRVATLGQAGEAPLTTQRVRVRPRGPTPATMPPQESRPPLGSPGDVLAG